MRNKYMKKISALIVTLLLLVAPGCEDYLDVNKNVDAPDYVEGYLYLAGITQQYQGLYWDGRALAPMTQMMGTTSFTSFATHYFSEGSDNGGEIWRMTYWNQGMNLENMINQSIKAEDWTLAGIGYALKAFSWDALTKEHVLQILEQARYPAQQQLLLIYLSPKKSYSITPGITRRKQTRMPPMLLPSHLATQVKFSFQPLRHPILSGCQRHRQNTIPLRVRSWQTRLLT